MSNEELLDFKTLMALIWGKLMIEKRYPEAILACVLGYLVSRSKPEDGSQREALSLLFKTMEELREEHGSTEPSSVPVCSFCGRREPEVQLAAGAGGFICSVCVQTASDVLKAPRTD